MFSSNQTYDTRLGGSMAKLLKTELDSWTKTECKHIGTDR